MVRLEAVTQTSRYWSFKVYCYELRQHNIACPHQKCSTKYSRSAKEKPQGNWNANRSKRRHCHYTKRGRSRDKVLPGIYQVDSPSDGDVANASDPNDCAQKIRNPFKGSEDL